MSGEIDVSKINCDLELKYNYMKYLFNQFTHQCPNPLCKDKLIHLNL